MNIETNTQAINDMMNCNQMYSGDMYSSDMYSGDMHSSDMYSGDMHSSNMYSGDMYSSDKCTGDYISISGEYCGEWLGAKIVKLPMWGAQEEDSDNYFEYPSSEEFAGMQPDVQLKSIGFGAKNLLLAAVDLELSNGSRYSSYDNDTFSEYSDFMNIWID